MTNHKGQNFVVVGLTSQALAVRLYAGRISTGGSCRSGAEPHPPLRTPAPQKGLPARRRRRGRALSGSHLYHRMLSGMQKEGRGCLL